MKEINSIFKVIHYRPRNWKKRKICYPTFRVNGDNIAYFHTLNEVERFIQDQLCIYKMDDESIIDTYAYVVAELPFGMEVNESDNYLSIRIYLSDGTLYGESQ